MSKTNAVVRRWIFKVSTLPAILLLLIPCAASRAGSSDPRAIPTTGEEKPELAAFDEAMRRFMAERNIPAGTLAVARDGRIVLERGYGYADRERTTPIAPDALMRLASVSKPITASAVHTLKAEGKLKLDARVVELLDLQPPDGQSMDPRWREITVRHLLDHEGGWDRDAAFDPMFRPLRIARELGRPAPATSQDVIDYMVGQPLQFDPGSRRVYSNFGYCLLGRVIETVTDRPYIDVIREDLMAPLGIDDVALGRTLPGDRDPREPFYSDPGRGRNVMEPDCDCDVPAPDGGFHLEAMDAHGGLIASASAVARFLQAYRIDGLPREAGPGHFVFFGSLPGTHTIALQLTDGTSIVALFNQRTDPSGLDYFAIKDRLEAAAAASRPEAKAPASQPTPAPSGG